MPDTTRDSLLPPLLRIAGGTALGMLALALLAGAAAAREAGLAWLVLDTALLGVAVLVVVSGFAALREAHARSAWVRGWVTLGAAGLLLLALFIGLD
jgi:hypothetical protein